MTGMNTRDEARQPRPPGIVLSSDGLGVTANKDKEAMAEDIYVAAKRAIESSGLNLQGLPSHRRQVVRLALLLAAKYAIEAERT